jgi:hypothetical protein
VITRYDLRAERLPSAPKIKMAGSRPVIRDPSKINSVVVHQMAAEFGATKANVTKYGREQAIARRALGIACHAAAFRDGQSVLATPATWYVQHGNGFNEHSLGLEIDGHHAGLADDPATVAIREDLKTTYGGTPTLLTDTLIAAARDALRWLVETARAEGCPLEWIYAHRQSSADRRSDPGELLWRAVVLDFAEPELGLRARPDVWLPASNPRNGPGKTIPIEWDPRGVGHY